MPLLVRKYGGTSVAGPHRIVAVAEHIAAARAAGNDLVVVVSAMGETTDELLRLAREVSRNPSRRELDMLITTGERVSMALLAMALHDRNIEAISFTGSQSGILTEGPHSAATIVDVKPGRIQSALERGRVVIVAGFQGVDPRTKEITTLGRGGSDTSAVALAVALGAERCELFKDVRGVFTADPRLVPAARLIPKLSYEACGALAHGGGQLLHARCVDLAAAFRMPLHVRSSFEHEPGTCIGEADMEGGRALAVTQKRDQSIAVAEGNAGARGEARGIIDAVAGAHPELELIAHEQIGAVHGAIVWAGPRAEVERLESGFRDLRGPGGEWRFDVAHGATFVSLVGTGLGATHATKAEAALERAGVPLVALRVTSAALIFRVPAEHGDEAVKALHATFLEGGV